MMKLVGAKYLKYTNQFRQVHHTLRMGKIKDIMKIPKSDLHFQRVFPPYPIQYTWNNKNIPLHIYQWLPQNLLNNQNKNNSNEGGEKAKAIVINFNALNAHTGLSSTMAQELSKCGIIMTGFDYPNFGKSHSPHPGHIDSLDNLIQISEQFLQHVMAKYPNTPVYLNGLSMGGLIAFQVGLRKPALIKGCILLNPAFKDNPVNNGFLKRVLMLGGMIFPKFKTIKPLKSHSTKHSLRIYKQKDRHMYSGPVWVSTTWALLSHMRRISKQQKFSQFQIPFLCIQGGTDKILDPFTVFQLQQSSKSNDKEIVIIPDLWHALWFDDHHDQVVNMVKTWILDRVQNRNQTANQIQIQKNQIQDNNRTHGRHIHHNHHHSHNAQFKVSSSKSIQQKGHTINNKQKLT